MQKDVYTILSLAWMASFAFSITFGYFISKKALKLISTRYLVVFYVFSVIVIDIVLVSLRSNPNVFVGLSTGLLMGLFTALKKK